MDWIIILLTSSIATSSSSNSSNTSTRPGWFIQEWYEVSLTRWSMLKVNMCWKIWSIYEIIGIVSRSRGANGTNHFLRIVWWIRVCWWYMIYQSCFSISEFSTKRARQRLWVVDASSIFSGVKQLVIGSCQYTLKRDILLKTNRYRIIIYGWSLFKS